MDRRVIFYFVPIAFFLVCWEFVSMNDTKIAFFASQPSQIIDEWRSQLFDPKYWLDIRYTASALILGYGIAVIGGSGLGLITYYLFKKGIELNFFILVLGSIPIFALAPLLILALGAGLQVRVAIVALSSIFLIASGFFQSAKYGDDHFGSIFRDLSKPDRYLWKKVIVPSAVLYSVPTLKGAVALSLIGVFVAEWISSQNGLGKYILSAMSLYDSERLMVGILSFMLISALFMAVISIIENRTVRWRNFR